MLIDHARNDVICVECGNTTYLHEGTFETYSAPEVRTNPSASYRYTDGCDLIENVASERNLPSHNALDACELYTTVQEEVDIGRDRGARCHSKKLERYALATAALLHVVYDLGASPDGANVFSRRYVPGLQTTREQQASRPVQFQLQDSDLDTWTGRWRRSRFKCDKCDRVFSTRKECLHHAPCNPYLHTRYDEGLVENRYVSISESSHSRRRIEHEINVFMSEEVVATVTSRRVIFDALHLPRPYSSSTSFHRAADNVTRLCRTREGGYEVEMRGIKRGRWDNSHFDLFARA